MIPSQLEYFERACEITVFPHPNAPGMAQVPPRTEGKSVSSTRCPVSSGTEAFNFCTTGRGLRTGHSWLIVISFFSPWNSSSITFSPTV